LQFLRLSLRRRTLGVVGHTSFIYPFVDARLRDGTYGDEQYVDPKNCPKDFHTSNAARQGA